MYVKIQASPLKSGDGNSGSCEKLVRYLEKENEGKLAEDKEYFFSHREDYYSGSQVISAIDKNKRKLMRTDAKFYSLIFSPSEKELLIIGEGTAALREYTRKVMGQYARNFNKGLGGDDLLYFGKVEFTRTAKGDEKRRKIDGEKYKSGEQLQGDNRHVHVVVSRKDITNKKKLSPMANARGNKSWTSVGKKPTVIGFDRDKFFQQCETTFDIIFDYKRDREDSYLHKNILANGTSDDRNEEIRLVDNLSINDNQVEKKSKTAQKKDRDESKDIFIQTTENAVEQKGITAKETEIKIKSEAIVNRKSNQNIGKAKTDKKKSNTNDKDTGSIEM